MSTIWAMGAMPLLGVRLSILSTVLPVILMAVGSAYGIHVVSHYFDEIAKDPNLSREEFEKRLFVLLKRVGRPVFLAALTTFVGFVSFCFTSVVPIFEFGIFSSFGVIAAFIVSVTFIPALLLILGPEKAKAPMGKENSFKDPLSDLIADTFTQVTRKRRSIVFLSGVLVLVSLAGLSKLVVDNVLVEYFKPTSEVARSERFIRENFGGSKVVSVVISSPVKGRVLSPDVLGPLDALETYLTNSVPEVGKVMGFTDLIKRINQVFNVDAPPEGLAALPSPPAPASPPATAGTSSGDGAFGFGFADTGNPDGKAAGTETTGAGGPSPTHGSLGIQAPTPPLTDKAMADLLSRAMAAGTLGSPTADRVIKNLYRLVNYQGYGYYEIPVDPRRYGKTTDEELQNLVSNYLVILSGNISSYADDPLEPKAIRLNILLRTVGQIDTNRAIEAINRYVADRFPKDVTVVVGGTALVERSLNNLVVLSQLVSILVSIFLVFLILAVYYRSIIAGLIGLTPLSISVLINFAVMGFTGIKLNIGTALVASVSVGIGIDYTIHYMAAYHHEYLITGGRGDFIRKTFYSSGKAIIFNAISVGAGFAVLILSQFIILEDLGFLIALTMGTSALIALTLLPVLLDWIKPSFIKRPLPSDAEEDTIKTQ
jgi:predicted RND superfamily exporter protein